MRVIAGEFRGRILLGPASDVTRPVTDRVKQSLFDILTPHLFEARVYDCFAGTGSMGLECLSRGAEHVTFFEQDPSALARLRRNIETLGVKDKTTIIGTDLFHWFGSPRDTGLRPVQSASGLKETRLPKSKSLTPGPEAHATTDLIFLDPPYRFLQEKPQMLVKLAACFQDHLKPDGVVIFRHDAADTLALPPLQVVDVRSYGSMTLEFLRPSTTNHGQPTTDK